ncbi:hypothetical protein DPMN_049538 [Dreissena polymorpha]|uniref:Uncharacterized protein n=1 Tax=Dreissena polymorpha TaxID=45954 RepID=A0A9D4HLE0_DREPO|nr:hypothetical protein DPMN_049538 [Dreissena polymorpha]
MLTKHHRQKVITKAHHEHVVLRIQKSVIDRQTHRQTDAQSANSKSSPVKPAYQLYMESLLLEQQDCTANAKQTYFTIRGGKAKRVDAASVVEAALVCGGKSHFAAKLRICPPRHATIRDMMLRQCTS